jgi:phage gp46-like protein
MAQVGIDPCAPPAPRCIAPIEQPFKPGFSTRPSPRCDGTICNLLSCGGGNWRVTSAGTLDRSRWIEGWIVTQLLTRGEVSCDEHPLGQREGGWWADAFRTDAFKSGSKLWSLQWAPVDNNTLMMAKQYATEALSYLLSWGIVSKLIVEPVYVSRQVMHLRISITGPGVSSNFVLEGQAMARADWLWDEYRPTARR